MFETTTLTPLGHKILDHWTGNLLYELMVVQKMDYQFAWEIATREWAFLPDEEDQPQLSFDPATLDPNQPLPAISA
jgi:hypothetical protein